MEYNVEDKVKLRIKTEKDYTFFDGVILKKNDDKFIVKVNKFKNLEVDKSEIIYRLPEFIVYYGLKN